MINKLLIIVIFSTSLWSIDYDLVFKENVLIKFIKNKKIGIISNIGNVFTLYHDNPMHHTRYYQLIEHWDNDRFIENQLKEILLKKGFSNINIIQAMPSLITLDSINTYDSIKKDIKNDLIKLLTIEKYDLIIYIEKMPERMFNRLLIKVNKKVLNNTNIGMYKVTSTFSANKEYLTATFNINVISIDNINNNYMIPYLSTYVSNSILLKKNNWIDTSHQANMKIVDKFENKMKKLFLLNLKEFTDKYIK